MINSESIFDISLIPKVCNIATITIFAKCTSKILINFEYLFHVINIEDCNGKILCIEFNKKKKMLNTFSKKNKESIKNKNFHNSMSIYVFSGKLLHINFFKNGTIHVTGAKQMSYVTDIIQWLCDYINKLHIQHKKIFENIDSKLFIDHITISMINLNIHIDWKINKIILFNILQENKCLVRWNRNNNIILEYESSKKQVIAITIYSKSMIISNCLCEQDIIEVYDYILYHILSKKNKIIYIECQEILKENNFLMSLIV